MPSTTVNTMPRHTSVLNPPSVPAADISLREFVVDEDVEHFNTALWRTIDQNAFILAQRDALEAFNVAKAVRLSEETAAAELERRNATLPSFTPQSSRYQSQPIATKKIVATPSLQQLQYSSPSDDPISRSRPHPSHTHAGASQGVNENRSFPSSSTSPMKSINSSSYHYQDKKAPASIAKQHSRNQLSLSTSSFPSTSSSSSSAIDSRYSRSTSQSNTYMKVPSLVLPSIPPVGDQRALSKRNPGVTNESTPSSSHSLVVVAPPLSAPQKSSTFSRNLRPGTIIPPTSAPSVSTPEGSKPHPPKPAPAPKKIAAPRQKAHLHNPFSDLQLCPQCGNPLTTPLIQLSTPLNSRSLCDALHTTCSSCRTRHCRGCTSISPCRRSCSAGQSPTSCAVRNCCSNVRALVIFETLNVFDHIFATEAGFAPTTTSADRVDPDPHGSFHSGRQQREAYIKLLISKADKSMRKFEDAFIRTLKVICSWLQYSPEDGFDAGDETSPAFNNPSYLNDSIPHLLLASYLPEVIHTFLINNNVRDWIAHSDAYNMILETLRWMSNFPSLSIVLNSPLPPIQRNCSLKQWATGEGVMNFLGYPSSSRKLVVGVEPIGDLIKKLEMHRSGLRAFAAKVQFEATLDKVNALCDAISYLLLQQVVGGI